MATINYRDFRTPGYEFEKLDCSVVALSIACEVPYDVAHDTLKSCGRKDRRKVYYETLIEAIEKLGYQCREWTEQDFDDVIDMYPHPHYNLKSITPSHPKRFPEAWAPYKDKKLIALTSNHYFAIHNGEVIDWSEGKALRVKWMFEVFSNAREQQYD